MKFSGDILKYRTFKRQYKLRVEDTTDSSDDRLYYLEQFMTGEANRIVRGYTALDATDAYPAALKELDNRYGNNDVIATNYIKKVLDWPTISADNPKALDEFAMFLQETNNAVNVLGRRKTTCATIETREEKKEADVILVLLILMFIMIVIGLLVMLTVCHVCFVIVVSIV